MDSNTSHHHHHFIGHDISFHEQEGQSYSTTVDKIIGGLTIVCIIVGITGNISSTIYFWRRRNVSFPHLLYTVVSVVDICIALSGIPVVASLFRDRQPVLFDIAIICGAWSVIFNFLQRFSMFLVLIVCSTRAIAILFPFYHLKKTVFLTGCACFGVFLLEVDAVYLGFGVLQFVYWDPAACCGVGPSPDRPPGITWTVYIMLLLLIVLLISIAVFASFIASTVAIIRRSKAQNEREKEARGISITIAIFTAVFIICNLPLFTQQLLSNCISWFELENFLDSNKFLYWYGWLLSHFFFTVLNAALNPLLYHLRFKMYREWVSHNYKEKKSDVGRTLTDIKTTTRRYSMRLAEGEHPFLRTRRGSMQVGEGEHPFPRDRRVSVDMGAVRAHHVPAQQRVRRKYASARRETAM